MTIVNVILDDGCGIRELFPDANFDGGGLVDSNGGEDWRHSYGMRTKENQHSVLLHCDFSVVPSTATIDDVTLRVFISDVSEGPGLNIEDYTWAIYKCLRNAAGPDDWVTDEATYNIYSTGNSWQVAGCKGAEDQSIPFATFQLADDSVNYWLPIDVKSIVEDAHDNENQIFNVVMEGYQVLSGESDYLYMKFKSYKCSGAWLAGRPYLRITYTPAGVEFLPQVMIF